MGQAFVFPGQGSHGIGMGSELADAFPVARYVFEEVDDALEQDLSRLMFEGPAEELTLTHNAQPALMAVSYAVTRVLEEEGGLDIAGTCRFVAGHSLGEYSALAAAGTFALADVARILRIRGQAMQRAVPVGEGAMAAILGLDLEAAGAVAAQAADGQVCTTANDNAPGQVVVSGNREAVERAMAIASEQGARRCVMLSVSAPFHCSLMTPAAEVMAETLSAASMARPVVPVVSNVTATAVYGADEIRRLLVEQVTAMVRWRESVLYMRKEGVHTMVEIGAGKVLTGLSKRIDKDLTGKTVGTPAEIEAFLKAV